MLSDDYRCLLPLVRIERLRDGCQKLLEHMSRRLLLLLPESHPFLPTFFSEATAEGSLSAAPSERGAEWKNYSSVRSSLVTLMQQKSHASDR